MCINKLIVLASLLILASCGNNSSEKPQVEAIELAQLWDSSNTPDVTEVDLTNLASVTFFNVTVDGITSNCVYSATQDVYGPYIGFLNLGYVSGDSFVCSKLTGKMEYSASRNLRTGVSTLTLKNKNLSLSFSL